MVCEGQTEQAFVKRVLAPYALESGKVLYAPLLGDVGHKGGNVEWHRVERDVNRLLRQRGDTRVTTLIDFYGIGASMLALARTTHASASACASAIESAIANAFGDSPRLVPYIQVHEFEALLFSDAVDFERGTGHLGAATILASVGLAPEEINSVQPPSKRILASFPDYDKVVGGALAAQAIGIPAMRAACPRFDAWLEILGV